MGKPLSDVDTRLRTENVTNKIPTKTLSLHCSLMFMKIDCFVIKGFKKIEYLLTDENKPTLSLFMFLVEY